MPLAKIAEVQSKYLDANVQIAGNPIKYRQIRAETLRNSSETPCSKKHLKSAEVFSVHQEALAQLWTPAELAALLGAHSGATADQSLEKNPK